MQDWHGTYTGTELERRWLRAWRMREDVEPDATMVQAFLERLGDEPGYELEDWIGKFTRAECETIADLWGIPSRYRVWHADDFWSEAKIKHPA